MKKLDEYIKTEIGCKIANLVSNPELLKVTTIKEKFLAQMEKLTCPMPQGLKVIGATRVFVILQQKNGKLARVHYTDWIEYLTIDVTGIISYKKAHEEAGLQFNGYTQLFET